MESKRINNLSINKASYLCREEDLPEHISYNINKYEPNPYYGRESDFIRDGEFYRPNNSNYDFCKIHKSCFNFPESGYAVASFDWDKYEECYELRFIGDRPMKLDKEERKAFWELIDYGFKQLNSSWYEDDSE